MSEFTAEQLIDAIRGASDLSELKRLVGPTQEQLDRARQRLRQMDIIWNHTERDGKTMSMAQEARYNRLMAEQTEFENHYC